MNTILITDKEKGNILMQVVLTYEDNGNKYVIYKESNIEEYYIARYYENSDKIETDLSDSEIAYGELVLKKAMENVKN